MSKDKNNKEENLRYKEKTQSDNEAEESRKKKEQETEEGGSKFRFQFLEFVIDVYEKRWFKVFLVISPIFGFLGLLITSIALFLTLSQNSDLVTINEKFEKQNQDLQEQYEKIQEIATSVPTRYLEKFPENFYELLNFLRSLENNPSKDRSLVIAKDAPAYGVFSNPQGFIKYRTKLKRIAGYDIPITMVVYDSLQRDKSMREQFSLESDNFYNSQKTKDFIIFLQSKEAKEIFDKEVYERYGGLIYNREPMMSNEDLFSIINLISETEVKKYRGWEINVEEVSINHELFYWIIDGEAAIFSLLNRKPINREASFMTYDNNFIEILMDNYDSMKER